MQNQSKREKIKKEIRSLRNDRKQTTDKEKKEKLLMEIIKKEDELMEIEFEDKNIKRFNTF